jgi:hypothetical protein
MMGRVRGNMVSFVRWWTTSWKNISSHEISCHLLPAHILVLSTRYYCPHPPNCISRASTTTSPTGESPIRGAREPPKPTDEAPRRKDFGRATSRFPPGAIHLRVGLGWGLRLEPEVKDLVTTMQSSGSGGEAYLKEVIHIR